MAQEFKPASKVRATKQQHSQQSMMMGQAQHVSLGAVTKPSEEQAMPLRELLARFTYNHSSTLELCRSLVWDVHGILRDSFRSAGLEISGLMSPHVIAQPSLDKARAQLSNLMTLTKDNLVATITKNDRVDSAVVLIDWQALEILCSLARKGLQSVQKFGDFAPVETFSQDEALQLAQLDIHKPLPNRQSIAERREALRAFANEADETVWEAVPQSLEDAEEQEAEAEKSHGQVAIER